MIVGVGGMRGPSLLEAWGARQGDQAETRLLLWVGLRSLLLGHPSAKFAEWRRNGG